VLAVSPSFVFMLIVRALFGFGTVASLQIEIRKHFIISFLGIASSVVLCPLYVAETVDPQKRGLMGGIFQVTPLKRTILNIIQVNFICRI